jgi:hypothetical protein
MVRRRDGEGGIQMKNIIAFTAVVGGGGNATTIL